MNPYFEQMILSASPIELIRLMYQKAIACVTDARDHLKAGRIRERGQAISRAYAIPFRVNGFTRYGQGAGDGNSLRKLYCYMQERLLEADTGRRMLLLRRLPGC